MKKKIEYPKEFFEMVKDVAYDHLRRTEKILYFIEFPDGSWLMEDKTGKTRNPLFALPIKYKEMAESFLKHYKLDKKLGCKVTEHEFVEGKKRFGALFSADLTDKT